MSKIYKTARGKSIDIDKIKLANETAVAVGNMRVNARGDQLGAGNKIAATRNQIMDQVYAVEDAPYSPNDSNTFIHQQSQIQADQAKVADTNVVQETSEPTIEKTEVTVPTPTSARGSLASTVVKKTS